MMDVNIYVQNSLVVSGKKGKSLSVLQTFDLAYEKKHLVVLSCILKFYICHSENTHFQKRLDHPLMQKKQTFIGLLYTLQQFQNSQYDVVDVAKPRGLRFLGVVKASSPIDSNVCLLFVQLDGTGWSTVTSRKINSLLTVNIRDNWGKYDIHSPTEPPPESWQNSNKPSNTGQSSPTLTAKQGQMK